MDCDVARMGSALNALAALKAACISFLLCFLQRCEEMIKWEADLRLMLMAKTD